MIMDTNRCIVNKEKLDHIHDLGNYEDKQIGKDSKGEIDHMYNPEHKQVQVNKESQTIYMIMEIMNINKQVRTAKRETGHNITMTQTGG